MLFLHVCLYTCSHLRLECFSCNCSPCEFLLPLCVWLEVCLFCVALDIHSVVDSFSLWAPSNAWRSLNTISVIGNLNMSLSAVGYSFSCLRCACEETVQSQGIQVLRQSKCSKPLGFVATEELWCHRYDVIIAQTTSPPFARLPARCSFSHMWLCSHLSHTELIWQMNVRSCSVKRAFLGPDLRERLKASGRFHASLCLLHIWSVSSCSREFPGPALGKLLLVLSPSRSTTVFCEQRESIAGVWTRRSWTKDRSNISESQTWQA